jgi:hypothetical protein
MMRMAIRLRFAHGWRLRAAIAVKAVLVLLVCLFAVPARAQTGRIAGIGLTRGWATFGQAVPKGAAVGGLQVGTLSTQTDVKSRWPDGSIRFAVVTVLAPASATYELKAAAASSGSFTPAAVDASVTLTLGGLMYVAALPATLSTDSWLAGALVHESRHTAAPASTTDGTPHPFLRVNFDRRVYNDATARLDVSVENVLDKAGATTVTYDVAVRVNGNVVFNRTAVQHYYLTRWRKVFTIGTTPLGSVTPDIVPFNQARALPPYLSIVTNTVSSPTGATFDILRQGALDANMPAHGGRAELAPYPDWTARYLVHRNPTQRSFVLGNGDLSGSWPIHVRESETSTKAGIGTGRYVSLDQRPTIWYDSRAKDAGLDYIKGTPLPIREYGSLTPGPGQTALIPDTAHQPSIAYVPYLLTGDRYYAEEMAFWANYSMMRTYDGDGVRNSKGVMANNEVRGFGWALRNLVDAAAYYPDASPMRAYLAAKLAHNLEWLDAYANSQDSGANPFRILWLYMRPDGDEYIGLWEQNYLAYAIDRANKQGFSGGLAHRDAIARFQLKLFTSDPAYPRSDGAPYIVGVGTPAAGGGFNFFRSMGEIWTATRDQHRDFGGYYGPEARLNLMIGVEAGWPGAQAALDYLWPFIGTEPFWGSTPDLGQRAGWALGLHSTALAAPVLMGPTGSVETSAPEFRWNASPGATAYQLWVNDSTGNILQTWYNAATTQCAAGGVCSIIPAITVAPGSATWWVRAWSAEAGESAWSGGSTFTRIAPRPVPPAAAVLQNPSGTISTIAPSFTWSAVPGVTHYLLWVNDASTAGRIQTWYTDAAAGCASGTGSCSISPGVSLAVGPAMWWIQMWNVGGGYGAWSSGVSFTITPPTTLGAATLIAPTGTLTALPNVQFRWSAVPGATHYYLWVNNGAIPRVQTWYHASTTGCYAGGSCSITLAPPLVSGAGIWWIQAWNAAQGYGPWSAGQGFVVP